MAGEPAVFPLEVHDNPAAGGESGDGPVRPCLWQRGQKMEDEFLIPGLGSGRALVALDKHLGEAGSRTEVAVDLEGRMDVEEVGQRAAAQQREIVFAGGVAISEAGAKLMIHARLQPVPPPPCLQAAVEHFAGPGEELRLAAGDQVEGMQADEVGDVAVTGFGFPVGLSPLEDAAVRPEADRRQLGRGRRQCGRACPRRCREWRPRGRWRRKSRARCSCDRWSHG